MAPSVALAKEGHMFYVYCIVSEAALQAGNSESIIRKHYLDLKSKEEAERFFGVVPAMSAASGDRASRVPAPLHELVVAA